MLYTVFLLMTGFTIHKKYLFIKIFHIRNLFKYFAPVFEYMDFSEKSITDANS